MFRRRMAAMATACLLVASLLGVSTGSASGAPAHRAVPIRFLHRVNPSARATASAAAAPALPRVSEGIADLAALQRIQREEEGITDEDGGEAGTGAPTVASVPIGSGKPTSTFEGLNSFDDRYSDQGNQFGGEPPDQGLCAGNGRVLEIVNTVMQVYTPRGRPLIEGNARFPQAGPVGLSLNQFFGVPSGFVRPDGPFGPFLFDVSCLFDPVGQRWFAISDENDLDPVTGDFSGPTALYVAVSTTANPLGAWNVYVIDTTNNGRNGTPNHHCSSTFCFGDFPHSGLDANGLYVTTDEFDNIGNGEFVGAQLYAISKADLEAGDRTPSGVYFETLFSKVAGDTAYALAPVKGLAGDWDTRRGGTTYFGMSLSNYTFPEHAESLSLWALTGTGTLDDATPDLRLHETEVATEAYSFSPLVAQMGGKTPFLRCVNMGEDCIGTHDPFQRGPIPLDSGFGVFHGAWIHDGVVYLTTDTKFRGEGAVHYDFSDGSWNPVARRVGIAYIGVRPAFAGGFSGSVVQQGYVAVARNNLTFPSIAIGSSGRGAIGVTLSGLDFNPSAAYIPFTVGRAPTSVQIGGLAAGPNDGFTGTAEGDFSPRWGDYGAATVSDSGSVWLAAEYIGQRCGFGRFVNDITCGFTRSFYANWSTRLFRLPS